MNDAVRPQPLSDIDIYSPDVYVPGVPLAQFKRLRDEAPVCWHPYPHDDSDGFWAISRHEDVKTVSRDHKRFSAQRGFVMIDDLPEHILPQAQAQLLGMDPPAHGPIRKAVIERFTTKRLAAMEPMVRAIAQRCIADARALSDCNFVFDVAGNLPTAVICSMFDIPESMWDQIRHWSDLQTAAGDPDLSGTEEEVQQASVEMGTYGFELAMQRKSEPGDDLISLLLNVEVDGHTVTEMEFASLFVQIAVAGNETTRGLISSGMHELLKRPDLYQTLEADPSKLPVAVEEMLRWSTPLHYFRRTATEAVELHGQQIQENDRVMLMYTSANFDDRVFDKPEQFNPFREKNPHLAFGHGIHLCLGANLARMEARIFFEEFFRSFHQPELLAEPQRIRSNLVNGYKQMPIKLKVR